MPASLPDLLALVILRWAWLDVSLIFLHGKTAIFWAFFFPFGVAVWVWLKCRHFATIPHVEDGRRVRYVYGGGCRIPATLKNTTKTMLAEWRNGRRSGLKNLRLAEARQKFVIFPVFFDAAASVNRQPRTPPCTLTCTLPGSELRP
jgi:hypothetical protein